MHKRRVITALFLFLFGLAPLWNSLGNPRLSGLRVPDFLQIMAVGLCFGAGLGLLLGGRKSP